MRLSGRKFLSYTQPWTRRQRIVLMTLMGANIGAFVAQLCVDAYQPGFIRDYLALSSRGVHDAYSWQFAAAMFLHNGPWHLFANMLVLYFLGRDIESILGQRHFLYLYLAGSIGGELGHLFLMPPDTILFAASGGVAAVVVAYATILPELDLIAWRFGRFSFHVKAKHVACAMLCLSALMFVVDRDGAVIHSAIPGALAAGWLYVNLLGFGHPSWVRRLLRRRRDAAERIERMTPTEFIELEIDPLLEKISRSGMQSLTRAERRRLAQAREKVN